MQQSARKKKIKCLSDKFASERLAWKKKNEYFHIQDIRYLSFLIQEDSKILDLGCGSGDLLNSLKPARGTGVDFSEVMIKQAEKNFPEHKFIVADIEDNKFIDSLDETFDYINISDTIGSLDDCQSTLASLHKLCNRETRLIISYYSYFWEPVLKVAELFGLKMPQVEQNYLASDDIINLLHLADFEVVKCEWKQLIPIRLMGIGTFINQYIATLPFIRRLCLRNYIIGRSMRKLTPRASSCTVVIPCKNERDNIEQAVKRIPRFCKDIEILFVEGHSQDGTTEEIIRVIEEYPQYDIKFIQQDNIGKADAVYKGFDHARGDVLMILDADLTMPPEELTKFWNAISTGQGEYINGSRLVYPMEKEAMRFLNLVANRLFSVIFTWLLNQRYTDTLCGTKVIMKTDYERMKANKNYFGDFDPFGDFFLTFSSSRLSLKVVEIPIPYLARRYGETQIQRFRNGSQLLFMVIHGYRKLKAF